MESRPATSLPLHAVLHLPIVGKFGSVALAIQLCSLLVGMLGFLGLTKEIDDPLAAA